jgi:uncharacterized protein (TIGR00290 family)
MTQNAIPVLISWSGGKDSALALYEIMKTSSGPFELFTTINSSNSRIAMHGISVQLLDLQAASLGLPLHKIPVPDPCSNEEYGRIMAEFLDNAKQRGITKIVFGDLFLEDIRSYREQNLSKIEMEAIFPLWGIPTSNVALEFIKKGFKAVVSCVDTEVLSNNFSGRKYDMEFLGDLPVQVDPCGENGEFHSFVYDGPNFSHPVKWQSGDQVIRYNRFCYMDILPILSE